MALTPRKQLFRLGIGTLGALVTMAIMLFTSHLELQWLFYMLSGLIALCIIYAIPGYIGIWVWRMRKFFFDMD